MAVTDRGQRLDAEEEAIEEPFCARPPCDAVWVDAIKNREEKIEADVDNPDKTCELRPAQAQEPAINVPPAPFLGADLDEFHLTGPNGNFIASASGLANSIMHD